MREELFPIRCTKLPKLGVGIKIDSVNKGEFYFFKNLEWFDKNYLFVKNHDTYELKAELTTEKAKK